MQAGKWIASAIIGVIAMSFALDVEAQRRLGGGKNLGKQSAPVQQRQATPPAQTPAQSPQAAPAQQPAAAPAAAAGAGARAASPMRGALIGLAAGLGLMALASWLGFGETLATIMLFLLLGLVIALVVGYVLRRMRGPVGPQPAYGTAGSAGTLNRNVGYETQPAPQPLQRTASAPQPLAGARPGSAMDEFMRGGAVNPDTPWGIPAGFDTAGFLANAKTYFHKLQAAWSSGSLDELSEFSTNDMFIALTHELRARGAAGVVQVKTLDATLLGIETLPAEYLASVRFTGTVAVDGEEEAVDEVWNLSKPVQGGGWLLAGIQQLS